MDELPLLLPPSLQSSSTEKLPLNTADSILPLLSCSRKLRKIERRGKIPRREESLWRVEKIDGSALADQSRLGRRHVAAGPAHPELDVLRGHVAELEGGLTDPRAVKELALAVNAGAHVEVTVSQFHGEVAV